MWKLVKEIDLKENYQKLINSFERQKIISIIRFLIYGLFFFYHLICNFY